jgi:hypothetical protein
MEAEKAYRSVIRRLENHFKLEQRYAVTTNSVYLDVYGSCNKRCKEHHDPWCGSNPCVTRLRCSDHPSNNFRGVSLESGEDNGKQAREFVREVFETLTKRRYQKDRGLYTIWS